MLCPYEDTIRLFLFGTIGQFAWGGGQTCSLTRVFCVGLINDDLNIAMVWLKKGQKPGRLLCNALQGLRRHKLLIRNKNLRFRNPYETLHNTASGSSAKMSEPFVSLHH